MRRAKRHPRSRVRWDVFLIAGLFLIGISVAGCGGGPPQQREPDVIFFPDPPDPARIQFLTSFRTNQDVGDNPGGFESFVLGDPKKIESIAKPYGVAIHDGVIYVADAGRGTVLTLDLKRHKFGSIRDRRLGKLKKPVGIFIEPDGTKYITDIGRRQVVVFHPDNSYKMALGDGKKMKPIDVAVSGDRVFVSDIYNHLIRAYDKQSGKDLFTFGSQGKDQGKFNKPTYLTVDANGALYVTDVLNFRIQKFNRDGKFLWSFGDPGDGVGNLARPRGVAVDRQGHIFVVDAAFENVQMFDANGKALMFFGGPGNEPGHLYLPVEVFVNYDQVSLFQRYADPNFDVQYLLLVTSQYGGFPVSVYGFGTLRK